MKKIHKPLCCLLALLLLSFGCAEVYPQDGLKHRLAHHLKTACETALDRAEGAAVSLNSLICRMFADADADLSDAPLSMLQTKLKAANRLSDRTVSGILPLFLRIVNEAEAEADALQQKFIRCTTCIGPQLHAEAEALDAFFGNSPLPSEKITSEPTDLTVVP